MKEIKNHNCPYCNEHIELHVRNPNNIIATSGAREFYSWSGLRLYTDDYYKCPCCNKVLYITRDYDATTYRFRNIPEVGFGFELENNFNMD